VSLHVEITDEENVHHFFSVWRVLFTLNSFHKAIQSTKLIVRKY